MHRIQVVAAIGLAAFSSFAAAQEQKKSQPPDAQALEQQGAEFARVGPEHKQLARLVGEWKTEAKSFYGDPDNPQTFQGTATFRRLLGGRFIQQNFQGEFGGQPFRGIGVSGYDNAKKKYVGVWIDTMGTGIMTTEGEYDPQKHELVETAVASTPAGEEKMKMVSRYLDDNKFIFTMYQIGEGGEETKMMEITYTRQGEAQKKKKR